MSNDKFGALSAMLDSQTLDEIEEQEVKAPTPKNKPVVKKEDVPKVVSKKSPVPKSAHKIVELDPDKIVPWKYDDRSDEEIKASLDQMVMSVSTSGQKVPILVRPLKNGKYEEIYGRVRLESCRALKIKVKAEIEELSDAEAAMCQIIENEDRKNLSVWDRAKSYSRLINDGIFGSVSALAARCNRDRSTVQKLISLANNAPESFVKELDLHVLGQNTMETLFSLCKENQNFEKIILEKYKDEINDGKMTAKKLKAIFQSMVNVTDKTERTKQTVTGKKGDYFTVSKNNNGALLINVLKKGRELISEEKIIELLKSEMDKS